MDFDCTTCSATLSSPSVTGRFLKKVTSISEAGAQEGSGGVMRPERAVKDQRLELGIGLLLQPQGVQSSFYHSTL